MMLGMNATDALTHIREHRPMAGPEAGTQRKVIGVKWRAMYAEAIEKRYRMLSFGDAMLLYRGTNVSS
jgi:hypothetical protein